MTVFMKIAHLTEAFNAPERPGHGVELGWAGLEALRVADEPAGG